MGSDVRHDHAIDRQAFADAGRRWLCGSPNSRAASREPVNRISIAMIREPVGVYRLQQPNS
jgi:hypothetical protein